jgi:hypothetical protein
MPPDHRAGRDAMNDVAPAPHGFSLVRGGPLFRLGCRVGCIGRGPGDPLRIVAAALAITWLPLLVVAAIERRVWGTWPALIGEPTVHARLLLGVPMLLLAECWADVLSRRTAGLLLDHGVVDERSLARAVAPAKRLRDSPLAEGVLLLLAVAGGLAALAGWGPWRGSAPALAAADVSAARVWYGLVALPLVQWLLYRWLWRYVVWTIALVRIARSRPHVEPAHPDGAGGLAPLSLTSRSFAAVAGACSCVLATDWAARIVDGRAMLADFGAPLALFFAIVLTLVLAPLLAFTPQLARAHLLGTREYGRLAADFARVFRRRWLHRRAVASSGSPDFEAMANLGAVYDRVASIRLVPFPPRAAFQLAAWTLVPMAPLLLLEVPLAELLRMLGGVLVGKLG